MKPLTASEEKLLKGRDLAIDTLLQNAGARALTTVIAEPGFGITSFLNAGVEPALKRAGFIVATFSDWQGKYFAAKVREAVAMAVRDQADSSYVPGGEPLDLMLPEIAHRTGKVTALLLDQFEDYLRCHAGTDRADSFDAELSRAVDTRVSVFVFGLQDQFVPAFERLRDHIPNLRRNRVVLDALTKDDARAAVTAQLEMYGLSAEPSVIEELLAARIAARPTDRIHPFFLKTATARLIEATQKLRLETIPLSVVANRGGIDTMILESLDTGINELSRTHVELLFHWCNILISPAKSRFAVTEKALMKYGGRLNRFAVSLLPRAVELHLLRAIETPDALRYEIARESLTPILRDWWERHEAALVARRRAQFRKMSISLALASIIGGFVAWLWFGGTGQ